MFVVFAGGIWKKKEGKQQRDTKDNNKFGVSCTGQKEVKAIDNNSSDNGNNNNGGKPKIVPLPNGPLYMVNDPNPKEVANLQGWSGQTFKTVVGIALCRCGGSKNKPFCDGTHGTIGFSSQNGSDGSDGGDATAFSAAGDPIGLPPTGGKTMSARTLRSMTTGGCARILQNASGI